MFMMESFLAPSIGSFTVRVCRASARPVSSKAGSAQAESSPSGGVEVAFVEAVRPGALVVLLGEVGRARPGAEGRADAGGVLLVAGAPGGGRDVHDVAPAPLVADRGDRVDHVAVPPDGVARADVGDAAERGQQGR